MFEVAGLPCTDHSRAGKRAGMQGATAPVFMAHAKIHVHKQTPLMIIENVEASECLSKLRATIRTQ